MSERNSGPVDCPYCGGHHWSYAAIVKPRRFRFTCKLCGTVWVYTLRGAPKIKVLAPNLKPHR